MKKNYFLLPYFKRTVFISCIPMVCEPAIQNGIEDDKRDKYRSILKF
jgi:hypothetical protein